jgi:hypothetical protein
MSHFTLFGQRMCKKARQGCHRRLGVTEMVDLQEAVVSTSVHRRVQKWEQTYV